MRKRLPKTTFYIDVDDFNIVSTPMETDINIGDRFVVCTSRDGSGFTQDLNGIYNFNNRIEITGDGVEDGYKSTFKLYVDQVQSYWLSPMVFHDKVVKSVGNALVLESTFNHDNMKYYSASVSIDEHNNINIGDWEEINKEDDTQGLVDIKYKNLWAWDIFTPFLQNSSSFSSLLFKLNTKGYHFVSGSGLEESDLSIFGTSISPMDVSSYYLKLYNISAPLYEGFRDSGLSINDVLIHDPSFTPEVCAGIYAYDTKYDSTLSKQFDGCPIIVLSNILEDYSTWTDGKFTGNSYLSCRGFVNNIETYSVVPHSHMENNNEVPYYDLGSVDKRYKNLFVENVNPDNIYFCNDTTSSKRMVTYITHSENRSIGGAGTELTDNATSRLKLYTKSDMAKTEASIELKSIYYKYYNGQTEEIIDEKKISEIDINAQYVNINGAFSGGEIINSVNIEGVLQVNGGIMNSALPYPSIPESDLLIPKGCIILALVYPEHNLNNTEKTLIIHYGDVIAQESGFVIDDEDIRFLDKARFFSSHGDEQGPDPKNYNYYWFDYFMQFKGSYYRKDGNEKIFDISSRLPDGHYVALSEVEYFWGGDGYNNLHPCPILLMRIS